MSRMALLVGINDYPGVRYDLQGCVNDITNVYDVLVKYFSFAPADIVLLSDSRARRGAIMDALKAMLARKVGDSLVFHFSGHGSQVPDVEGDEEDGKDEVICPFDFDWRTGLIKDDDLAGLIAGMKKGVHLEVILDSCHSGTWHARDDRRPQIASGRRKPRGRGRLLEQHALHQAPIHGTTAGCCIARQMTSSAWELPVRRIARIDGMSHVLWSACRANQYSADADIGGAAAGAFNVPLLPSPAGYAGQVTRNSSKLVRASLKHEGYSQVPQMEGPAGSAQAGLFGSS